MKEKVGILHPGEMGISVGASAGNSGCPVYWASEGRSGKTRERAEKHALVELPSLAALCDAGDIENYGGTLMEQFAASLQALPDSPRVKERP